mmetsp:Transcript_403/g.710  ORF Transcript_403/g.710 Transcript_403/m.710 type:complete len:214 (-) Transcript_403:95-736(-)
MGSHPCCPGDARIRHLRDSCLRHHEGATSNTTHAGERVEPLHESRACLGSRYPGLHPRTHGLAHVHWRCWLPRQVHRANGRGGVWALRLQPPDGSPGHASHLRRSAFVHVPPHRRARPEASESPDRRSAIGAHHRHQDVLHLPRLGREGLCPGWPWHERLDAAGLLRGTWPRRRRHAPLRPSAINNQRRRPPGDHTPLPPRRRWLRLRRALHR